LDKKKVNSKKMILVGIKIKWIERVDSEGWIQRIV